MTTMTHYCLGKPIFGGSAPADRIKSAVSDNDDTWNPLKKELDALTEIIMNAIASARR